jgi:hypothetical protein
LANVIVVLPEAPQLVVLGALMVGDDALVV